ncbi:MAG: LCP family protein [Sedimentibacter sp.]|uniref:LCP family protein n=1 Tax=Sedimentibacter sp. TaxID=1960295 RepID=UPI002980ADAD|nr:LCP family protein [Sedimentibacter sp.]MDW5299551.1 LCP family protein [Sedimentibacter sp.]
MKQFIKVFIFSLLIFSFVLSTGIFAYVKFFSPQNIAEEEPDEDDQIAGEIEETEFDTPLEKAIHESKRINVLLVGLEGTRSDTMMLASFDRKTKDANIISIPRDTYYQREGYSKYSETQKINAIYGMEEEGIEALTEAVENLTGLPINNYVTIDYDGVRAAVDAIGGVEVDVPFHMRYTDPYDDPPLDINIPAGKQIIYGDKAMEFLRFRKTNYEGYSGYINGDLGRVEVQQKFIKSAIDKSLSLKLPSVISAVYPYVKTDITLTNLLGLGKDAIGFSTENLETTTLPGTDKMVSGLSFYFPDGEEMIKIVYDMYGVNLSAYADDKRIADATE